MKKRLFLFIGVLCSFGFYSCQKSSRNSDQVQTEEASVCSQTGKLNLLFLTHLVLSQRVNMEN
jgi:hypothetical protein